MTNDDYFSSIIGHTIVGAGIIDDELLLTLDNGTEIWVFDDGNGMSMQFVGAPFLDG